MKRLGLIAACVLILAMAGAMAWGGVIPATDGSMTRGAVELTSIGPLTFSPNGTLFVGDSYGGRVYAIALDEASAADEVSINVEGIDARVASLLGTARDQVRVHDVTVSPVSRNVYLSVSRGTAGGDNSIKNRRNPGATPHVIRVDAAGRLHEVDLSDVRFSTASIEDVRPESKDRRGNDRRAWNILEMSFVDDVLYVSGMSNEEWSSKLRRLPYPFEGEHTSNALKIFHTAHGRYETYAPARVFVPYEARGGTRVFAGFSCTPLVDFSLAEMNAGERVEGRTIAELGAGNHVLDMITVRHRGEIYFLLANHLHPFMRLALSDFEGAAALRRPSGRAGIDRAPIDVQGVIRLASDRDTQVVLLQERARGLDLRTMPVDRLVD